MDLKDIWGEKANEKGDLTVGDLVTFYNDLTASVQAVRRKLAQAKMRAGRLDGGKGVEKLLDEALEALDL